MLDPSTSLVRIDQEGGAITSFQSTVTFSGMTMILSNQASNGGALLAVQSTLIMYGEIIVANNTAINQNGGGVSLKQSVLEIRGNCDISYNVAVRGGGIHASSSTINIYQPGVLQFTNNHASNGSGIYLEVNTQIFLLKYQQCSNLDAMILLIFVDNYANYGGAMYVADDTNSGACSRDNECFIQSLTQCPFLDQTVNNLESFILSGNIATEQGSNLFGGLLDRCIANSFAEVLQQPPYMYVDGVTYLNAIHVGNITSTSIASEPVRVCFCTSAREINCSYQPPTINARKGETFTVSLVAVDQADHAVSANIASSLSSTDGGFGENQQTQSVGGSCSELTFNVFSPHDTETIILYADGPCGSAEISTRNLSVQFLNCTCAVGFKPLESSQSRCECVCDRRISTYITSCNATNSSLLRVNTASWITYVNDSDPPKYIIHSYCPLDYCHPSNVEISTFPMEQMLSVITIVWDSVWCLQVKLQSLTR